MSATVDEFWLSFHVAIRNIRAVKGVADKVFRGQTRDYPVLPSIVRDLAGGKKVFFDTYEPHVLAEFKRVARPFLKPESIPSNELEWMIVAQHYGCPTRLIDWTTNPLVALFFACEGNDDSDGVVHIVEDSSIEDRIQFIDLKSCYVNAEYNESLIIEPTVSEFGTFIRPPYSDQRYLNQSTVLLLCSDPFREVKFDIQRTLIVPRKIKSELRSSLREMGISAHFIYPGLEGAARDIKMHVI